MVAGDAREGWWRREDNTVEIRKSHREENLQKKCREGLQFGAAAQPFRSQTPSTTPPSDKKIESLPQMVAGVYSEDRSTQLKATTQFRKLLSIDHQALPCLLNLLTQNYMKSINKEACWTISNITAGTKEQIQAVIEAGIIAPLSICSKMLRLILRRLLGQFQTPLLEVPMTK